MNNFSKIIKLYNITSKFLNNLLFRSFSQDKTKKHFTNTEYYLKKESQHFFFPTHLFRKTPFSERTRETELHKTKVDAIMFRKVFCKSCATKKVDTKISWNHLIIRK